MHNIVVQTFVIFSTHQSGCENDFENRFDENTIYSFKVDTTTYRLPHFYDFLPIFHEIELDEMKTQGLMKIYFLNAKCKIKKKNKWEKRSRVNFMFRKSWLEIPSVLIYIINITTAVIIVPVVRMIFRAHRAYQRITFLKQINNFCDQRKRYAHDRRTKSY